MVTMTTLRLMTSLCIVTLVNSAAVGDAGDNQEPQSRQQWQEVSPVKRGVLVDGSQKVVDVATKIEAIIDEIKNVFKKDGLVDPQGNTHVVDIAVKIEAIIDEIKEVLQTQNLDRKTAIFLHTAMKKVSVWFKELRVSHEIPDEPQSRQQWQEVSPVKRGVFVDGSQKLVGVATKLEAIIEEIKNVFKQDVAIEGNTQVDDIVVEIEAINDEIKKVLKAQQVVDIAVKIEAIIDEIKKVLQTQNLDKKTAIFLHTAMKEVSMWFNELRVSHK